MEKGVYPALPSPVAIVRVRFYKDYLMLDVEKLNSKMSAISFL